MKNINKYINERLHITTKSNMYAYYPETKYELKEIIIQHIEDDGPECDLNDIDVSKITDMSHLFDAEVGWGYGNKIFKDFNGDISRWDVSNVTNMEYMFYNCEEFNCDISKWDVSNVKDMSDMFCQCKEFNCNINLWNVSNVKIMAFMFKFCESFNCDISNWNVSNVKNMQGMFYKCPTKPKWYKD